MAFVGILSYNNIKSQAQQVAVITESVIENNELEGQALIAVNNKVEDVEG